MEKGTVIKEKTFNAPIEKVWKALTDKEQMKEWYFDIPDFKLEVGHEFQFLAGHEEKKWLHLCKITEITEGQKIAYSWRYAEYPGDSTVSFELTPDGDKTHLKLTHTGLDSFPDIDDFRKENFMQGWTYFVDEAITNFVEK